MYIGIAIKIVPLLWKRYILRREEEEEIEEFLEEPQGLMEEEIQRIPNKLYTKSIKTLLGIEQTACSICVEDYQYHEDVTPFPECEHLYHTYCIRQWLEKSSVCPLCRFDAKKSLMVNPIKWQW